MATPESAPVAPSIPYLEFAELSSTADGAGPAVPSLSERLADLAHLASASVSTSTENEHEDEAAQSIHSHLDAIESILRDPRPALSREVAKCRPDGVSYGRFDRSRASSLSSQAPDQKSNGPHIENGFNKTEMLAQLSALLTEVNGLHAQVGDRRKETSEICDLYEERCRCLERTVAELELEVMELKSDLVEDAVELEGIQGTILGLQTWIDSLLAEQVMLRRQRYLAQHKARQKRWANGQKNGDYDDLGADTKVDDVLEGLDAWMRGLRDVEEGFRSRARARRTRRERRREMLEGTPGVEKKDEGANVDTDAGLWSRAFPAQLL
ncbi:hypothetical protein N7448_004680 [Penicillium atrosanguineum]|uniref:Uncharacterized protein n=1 Tax=Penicillium atrosanguineum TaxID=1132637 RepID=A0A9W9PPX0_9EURO|nr:hypothetical protein N7448_004680 [Penicillium atrosanguineum]KAJ5303500.1 hypothetical protein N7476_010299 [Penicillium atrosanguineum]